MKPSETMVGGRHYQVPIQPVHYIHENLMNFMEGCVVKYMTRWRVKGSPLSDLKKSIHFIELIIELEGLKPNEIEEKRKNQVIAIDPAEYAHANRLNFLEGTVIDRITTWRTQEYPHAFLTETKNLISKLITLENLKDAEHDH